MSKLHISTIAALLLSLAAPFSAHAAGGTLKVCADPDYLPYSNRAGQGFENAVAETVAKAMGQKLEYVWADMRGHGGFPEYLSRNLDSGKCDVVMNMPYGNDEELTTDPYYVSSYVFVFKKDKGYTIEDMNSADLRKLKLGFEGDTPVEAGLQIRGLVTKAKSFDVSESSGRSPRSMLEAVQNGQIDVMITWQPAIGAFLHDYPELTTVALPNTRATGSPEMYSFPMSMAVRKGDDTLRNKLNAVIKQQQSALTGVLHEHGVQLFGEGASPSSSQMANL
ncbi:MAG TPA: transporter substrate-binding domain-containing protein [Dyella sp.]|uniref:transporter substrate-binding domain-containing protein n=1 Tax=Dyella sp. TaxID=1869338 RepID=UPI002F955F8E